MYNVDSAFIKRCYTNKVYVAQRNQNNTGHKTIFKDLYFRVKIIWKLNWSTD